MKKIFPNLSVNSGAVAVDVNLDRFDNQYDKAQMWLDNEVKWCSGSYVPMNTGTLFRSVETGTVIGSGEVVWDCQYARRCYYGLEMNFRVDKHPQAQAQWFEAAKAANKDNWLAVVRQVGGGGE